MADEIDIGVNVIGGRMVLEIVEEGGPAGQEPVRDIAQWEREAVIDRLRSRSAELFIPSDTDDTAD